MPVCEWLTADLKDDDLRQRLQMRGVRSYIVYTHAATRINVIPLCASKFQAVRLDTVKTKYAMCKMIIQWE